MKISPEEQSIQLELAELIKADDYSQIVVIDFESTLHQSEWATLGKKAPTFLNNMWSETEPFPINDALYRHRWVEPKVQFDAEPYGFGLERCKKLTRTVAFKGQTYSVKECRYPVIKLVTTTHIAGHLYKFADPDDLGVKYCYAWAEVSGWDTARHEITIERMMNPQEPVPHKPQGPRRPFWKRWIWGD